MQDVHTHSYTKAVALGDISGFSVWLKNTSTTQTDIFAPSHWLSQQDNKKEGQKVLMPMLKISADNVLLWETFAGFLPMTLIPG